eukprot:TRINITY_DN2190_c0_g1_i2.p1 TRINITY_DN2190_c0_g1~~TRINITY_DN2190_c0_g1_i2.p1  ORF type:complete len:582 (+),score=214.57 TRINITY_DN2190_c0_g1_i2:97-1842(+)
MSTPQYQSYGGTTARTDTSPASRLDVFKKPPDPDVLAKVRKRKVKVLDEDEFVENVEKIIERDFFPEMEKLKAQNEYLDAKAKGDFATMNRLQEKYSGCRPGTGDSTFGGVGGIAGGRRMTSPATFETPEEPRRENDPRRPDDPFNRPGTSCSTTSSTTGKTSLLGDEEKEQDNLDKFLANHTSEDNESFYELQKEAEKKHRLKNAWMYKDEKLFLENKAKEMALPSIEDQAALPEKPGELETWTYQNINSVFHNPDTLELSYEEKLDLAKKQKVIKHDNTRLSKAPWKSEKQAGLLKREADRQREMASGKVGADGKELVRPETPMVNGYKLMSMAPSPALGVADSPLMTWGEVESTPFRLEGGGETPLFPIAGAGKGFTIKDVPERDKIAKELADKNSRYYRERKAKALQQVKTSMKVGRPGSGRPHSALPNLSPAAKRLVSSKLGIRLGTDEMLRASYTPTPGRSARGTPTPTSSKFKSTPTPNTTKKLVKTPANPSKTPSSSGTKSTPSAAGSKKSVSIPSSGDITDNLLYIPRRGKPAEEKIDVNTDNLLNISGGSGSSGGGGGGSKRQRAQDFFGS